MSIHKSYRDVPDLRIHEEGETPPGYFPLEGLKEGGDLGAKGCASARKDLVADDEGVLDIGSAKEEAL
jgi:hypothetical protein